jgi:4-aminobutyrate aminotransferase-like enzyme
MPRGSLAPPRPLSPPFPLPSPLPLVPAGSEANDLALRLARAHTGKRGVLTVGGAYHGHLTSLLEFSPYKYRHTDLGRPGVGWVRETPAPDVYSGPHRGSVDDERMGAAYTAEVQKALDEFAEDERGERAFAAARAERQAGGPGGRLLAGGGPAPAAPVAARPRLFTSSEPTNPSAGGGGGTNSPPLVPGSPGGSSDRDSDSDSGPSPPPSSSSSSSSNGASSSSTSLLALPSADDLSAALLLGSPPRLVGRGTPPPLSAAASAARFADANVPDDGLSAGCGAYFCESLLSCGGQVELPKGYLRGVYAAVRAAGGVCIADEVQVGFGRIVPRDPATGAPTGFWAFQTQGPDVVPDIVTMGKPMGNGFPCAGVVTTPSIAASFRAACSEYFNTFGGNPVAAAACTAVLDVIEREGLVARAQVVGDALLEGFHGLEKKYGVAAARARGWAGAGTGTGALPIIGSVRGRGLMVGLEFIENPITRAGDGKTASRVKYAALSAPYRMLLSTDGMSGEVVKLKPPMCFSLDNAREVVQALDEILGAMTVAALQEEAGSKAAGLAAAAAGVEGVDKTALALDGGCVAGLV